MRDKRQQARADRIEHLIGMLVFASVLIAVCVVQICLMPHRLMP